MTNKLFIIAGPPGVGKSYLMQRLLEKYPSSFTLPPLITTRQPRPNEKAIDRLFVSEAEYERMSENGDFVWSDSFFGNHYGYTHRVIVPHGKHGIINILPPMISQFAVLPSAFVIGMTVAPDNLELLENRLVNRGDPPIEVERRIATLKQHVAIMAKSEELIQTYGKLFVITGNDTIPDEVMPFIAEQIS